MADHELQVDGSSDVLPIAAGNIELPGAGAWTMEALLSSPTTDLAAGQRVAVTIAGVRRVGTIARAGAEYLQTRVRVVGGAGKLDAVIESRDYRGYNADRIAQDILRDAGETFGSGWSAFSTYCPHWQRATAMARTNLQRVMRLTRDYRWRVDHDGAISLYHDADLDVGTAGAPSVSDAFYDRDDAIYPQEGHVVLAPATSDLEPGMLFDAFGASRLASRVAYRIGNDSMRLRCDAWFT